MLAAGSASAKHADSPDSQRVKTNGGDAVARAKSKDDGQGSATSFTLAAPSGT